MIGAKSLIPPNTNNVHDLIRHWQHIRDQKNKWIAYQIVHNQRIDILAHYVLGYDIEPGIHDRIMKWQVINHKSLILAFRGAGKTTVGTIVKCIHLILRNPDTHILLASKTLQNAQDFLKEIKGHFESNQKFIEIFGDYVGRSQWDERSIEVSKRTKKTKEPTIMTVGVDGAVASKHYDVIIADDLVEEDNSRTQYMRDKLKKWFYQNLIPTLEPPSQAYPDRGQMHLLGTHYHWDDLYTWLEKHEYAKSTMKISIVTSDQRSVWPNKYTIQHITSLRTTMGSILFGAQFECNVERMRGKIFKSSYMKIHDDIGSYPVLSHLKYFQGSDLAIGENSYNDEFASVVVGLDQKNTIWVMEAISAQLSYTAQTAAIAQLYQKWKPMKSGIEAIAYQKIQLNIVKDVLHGFRGVPIYTSKGKIDRAWKLSAYFERGDVHLLKEQTKLIDQLYDLSSNNGKDDLFDALDFAITMAIRYGMNQNQFVPNVNVRVRVIELDGVS